MAHALESIKNDFKKLGSANIGGVVIANLSWLNHSTRKPHFLAKQLMGQPTIHIYG